MRAGLTPSTLQWCRCGRCRGRNLAESVAVRRRFRAGVGVFWQTLAIVVTACNHRVFCSQSSAPRPREKAETSHEPPQSTDDAASTGAQAVQRRGHRRPKAGSIKIRGVKVADIDARTSKHRPRTPVRLSDGGRFRRLTPRILMLPIHRADYVECLVATLLGPAWTLPWTNGYDWAPGISSTSRGPGSRSSKPRRANGRAW